VSATSIALTPHPAFQGASTPVPGLLISLQRSFQRRFGWLHQRLIRWTRPKHHSLLMGTVTDLTRTRSELIAENALLR
jgi:hypothetical protein